MEWLQEFFYNVARGLFKSKLLPKLVALDRQPNPTHFSQLEPQELQWTKLANYLSGKCFVLYVTLM